MKFAFHVFNVIENLDEISSKFIFFTKNLTKLFLIILNEIINFFE